MDEYLFHFYNSQGIITKFQESDEEHIIEYSKLLLKLYTKDVNTKNTIISNFNKINLFILNKKYKDIKIYKKNFY